MARRKRAGGHGYSLLLKDSVIYGAGRALQKPLVALLLPLYTAFLSQADYGILGMVVTVTTFLDVFVTLGFDVAFSRFYFDDRSEAARRCVITNVFYVSTVYPFLLLGTAAVLMPRIAPLLLGKEYDADDWRCFVIGLTRLSVIKLDDTPFTPLRREHTPPDLFHLHLSPHPRPNLPPRSARRCVPPGPCGVSLVTLFTAAGMQASLLPPCIREVDWRLRCGLMKPVRGFVIPALLTSVSFMPAQVVDLALPAASPGRGRGRCSGW